MQRKKNKRCATDARLSLSDKRHEVITTVAIYLMLIRYPAFTPVLFHTNNTYIVFEPPHGMSEYAPNM